MILSLFFASVGGCSIGSNGFFYPPSIKENDLSLPFLSLLVMRVLRVEALAFAYISAGTLWVNVGWAYSSAVCFLEQCIKKHEVDEN